MKHLILAVMMIAMLALVANATAPPAHGVYQAGWGMNPNTWQTTTGSFSAWGLYAPSLGSGGSGWVVDWTDPNNLVLIDYAPITLELWIEMYSLQTYHYTSYQWHRLGDAYEEVCFTIEGILKSNNGQYVILEWDGTDELDHLYFRHNVLDGSSPGNCDIPLTWQARWGTGVEYGVGVVEGWHTPAITGEHNLYVLIPDPCDHWFQFEGCFEIPYHQPDGYYSLTMAGCPAPVM
jgi:hypothetical protein